MFTAALFTIAKIRKQPKCPLVDEWMKTVPQNVYHIYTMEYYLAIKKEIVPFLPAWMDLENIIAK